jgi:hypothetical protein
LIEKPLLGATPAIAQYRYTDDKGVTKTAQYKLDISPAYRDEAARIGPTGIGKPVLSEQQRLWKQTEEAYRRIHMAEDELARYRSEQQFCSLGR